MNRYFFILFCCICTFSYSQTDWLHKLDTYLHEISNAQNYYEILNVPPNASQKEIKRAYLSLIMKFHPDKIHNDSEIEEELATKVTRLLNAVYSVLSDEKKRVIHDRVFNIYGRGPLLIEHESHKKKSIDIRVHIQNIWRKIILWAKSIQILRPFPTSPPPEISDTSVPSMITIIESPLPTLSELPSPLLTLPGGSPPMLPGPPPMLMLPVLPALPTSEIVDYSLHKRSFYSRKCEMLFRVRSL